VFLLSRRPAQRTVEDNTLRRRRETARRSLSFRNVAMHKTPSHVRQQSRYDGGLPRLYVTSVTSAVNESLGSNTTAEIYTRGCVRLGDVTRVNQHLQRATQSAVHPSPCPSVCPSVCHTLPTLFSFKWVSFPKLRHIQQYSQSGPGQRLSRRPTNRCRRTEENSKAPTGLRRQST